MSWMLLLLIALPSEVPERPNGRLLSVGTTCWRYTVGTDRLQRDVTMEMIGGRETLRIVERRKGPNIDRRDELLANREDLLPIAFRRHDYGRPTMDLDYVGSWIVGWREIDGGRSAVATRPDRVVWDGNMLAPLRTALPRYNRGLPVFRDNRIIDEILDIDADSLIAQPRSAASAHLRQVSECPHN